MIKLSTQGRYGLSAMVELAGAYGEGPLGMSTISERQGISQKYLHTLLTALKRANLVTVVRGARGGFGLSREPDQILVSEVWEALEGKISIIDCLTNRKECSRIECCETREFWETLNNRIKEVLSSTNLADLMIRV